MRIGVPVSMLLVSMLLGGSFFEHPARAGSQYEPTLEWNGVSFVVRHTETEPQRIAPEPEGLPFIQPRAVAARTHDGREVVYVLDAGRHRVVAFEVNATERSWSQGDLEFDPTPGAGEYSDVVIRPPEFLGAPQRWVIPFSEIVVIEGVRWERVEELGGFAAEQHVYTVDYGATSDHPEFRFPPGALSQTRPFHLRYLLTDLRDAGLDPPSVGYGDVDLGLHHGSLDFTRTTIDELSGGPLQWDEPRSLALSPDPADSTGDLLFLLDAGESDRDSDEQLFSFAVDESGGVTAGERYGDRLHRPHDVAVAERPGGRGATAWVDGAGGPFAVGGAVVVDANLVTGRSYRVDVAAGVVGITDVVTGRAVVEGASVGAMADPFYGVPGVRLALNAGAWQDGATYVRTGRAEAARFLFVADTGADRLKVVALAGAAMAVGTWAGDWLPGDEYETQAQPTAPGTVGALGYTEHRVRTPGATQENWSFRTLAQGLREATLDEIIFDPDGSARSWRRVDELEIAGPSDPVFSVDDRLGRVLFGDGIHGEIPPADTELSFRYTTSPDIVRFGESGTGLGRFTAPRGIAARWNAVLNRFDLYVADTGNLRLQKLAFFPAEPLLGLEARVEPIVAWRLHPSSGPETFAPVDLAVARDASGRVHLAVSDLQGRRLVFFEDLEVDTPGSHREPILVRTSGGPGNQLGRFVSPHGLTYLQADGVLDLYAADDARGVVTKFEPSPAPIIELSTVGGSALPARVPPGSGYEISFETRFAPLGGWVDFYVDLKPNFDFATARACFAPGVVSPQARSVFWRFADSPGGPPPDGDYFLFARLQDPSNNTVAWDQTDLSEILTIDSSLSTALQARDALDGDGVLLLQNGLERAVSLQVVFPDSVIGAGFGGTFDPGLVEIVGVTAGAAWDGLGATETVFSHSYDNVAGRFTVDASVTGVPVGLTRPGPHDIATILLRARPEAITATQRWRVGRLALDPTRCGLLRAGSPPDPPWRVRSLDLRVGYLGDIATTDEGADSTAPHLEPRPDGRIDFDDQLVFTLGWNGRNFVQDPISDLGPVTRTTPNLWPHPDRRWNVDDIVAFTSQASFFVQTGWNTSSGARASRTPSSALHAPESASNVSILATLTTLATQPPNPTSLTLTLEAVSVCDLMGAHLTLDFDATRWTARIEPGDWFGEPGRTQLFLATTRDGRADIGITRLDPLAPVVSGSGLLATVHLSRTAIGNDAIDGAPNSLRIAYDLRGEDGRSVETAEFSISTDGTDGTDGTDSNDTRDLTRSPFSFIQPWPNPARGDVVFELSAGAAAEGELTIFDIAGRQIRRVFLRPGAQPHRWTWDGRDAGGRTLPAGVYVARWRAGPRERARTILMIR